MGARWTAHRFRIVAWRNHPDLFHASRRNESATTNEHGEKYGAGMVRVPPIGFYKETGNEFFTHQKCCIGRSHSFSACVWLQKESGGSTGATTAAATSTSRTGAACSAGDHVTREPDHNQSRPRHNLDMGSQKCRKCSHRTGFGRSWRHGQSFRESGVVGNLPGDRHGPGRYSHGYGPHHRKYSAAAATAASASTETGREY